MAVHIRFGAIHLLLFSAFINTHWGQVPTKPAGFQFESVQVNFAKDVENLPKIRDANAYPPADVNAAMQRAKKATLAPIPLADKPLRSYVEQVFPQPVDETTEFVQKEEAEQRFGIIRQLLAKLTRLDSFRLNLTVASNPSRARFELVPRVGTRIASTTNSKLTNIYRGEYDYYVTKAGYKQIHETINFIDRAGTILECELQPDTGAEEALPCNFR